jgi:AraC-like DNA-binding protein
MLVSRAPRPSLRPFVKRVWAADDTSDTRPRAARERVLPTGSAHIAFRLSEPPLVLFDSVDDPIGRIVGHAVLGGPRSTFYVRDVSAPSRSVGAQLEPGAASLLTGLRADELAERHTPLTEIWTRDASELRERLLETASPEHQLDLLEEFLATRLPKLRGLHPAIAHALERFSDCPDVSAVVKESGYSHRRFIALFRAAVGLTPKLYCRVTRFQSAVLHAAREPSAPLTELALAAGFSDQPHLNRDFRELAGLSPGHYRELAPQYPHHVPIARRGR